MSRCRSCDAPLLWARTDRGRVMPLDRDPYQGDEPAGLFVLRDAAAGTPLAVAVPAGVYEDEPRYRAHFATCPNAAQHRRTR